MRHIAALLTIMCMLPTAYAGAETGVATPVLSYCAHWYARSGTACITTAQTGDLVGADANNPQQVNAAMNHCKQAGCKVALYCECGYNGVDAGRVAQLYAEVVQRHGTGVIIPHVEVDHIADISPQRRSAVLQELARHGFGLMLKNSSDVASISAILPVTRVVYEDIVNDQGYRAAMLRLAQQYPQLLITGIVHQGSYGPALGGARDPGATPEQADAVFAQFKDFKNVELFYGMPDTYRKAKSFDGGMTSIAREIGSGTPTGPGPGALMGSPASLLSRAPGSLLGTPPFQGNTGGSPLSRIAPPNSGPLPSYLNPVNAASPQTIAPSQLSGSTDYNALLEAITGSTSPPAPSRRVTISSGSSTQLAPTRIAGGGSTSVIMSSTSVTTFPAPTTVPTESGVRELLSTFVLALRNLVLLIVSLGGVR